MFGIDDALIWMPLAGAVAGGLMNKKDPLKGALLGAGMGYGGGLLAPEVMGTAAASGADKVALAKAAEVSATPALGMKATAGEMLGSSAPASLGFNGSTSFIPQSMQMTASGTPSAINAANPSMFKQVADVAKPMGNVINTAAAAKTLFSSSETPLPPIQASPVNTGQGGGQALAQLVTNNNQKSLQLQQDALQRKQRRMGLLGG